MEEYKILYGCMLNYVPTGKLNQQVCAYYVDTIHSNIKYVPEEFITIEMCEKVLFRNAMLLEYIPEKFQSEKLCLECVLNSRGKVFKYVSESFKYPNLYTRALEMDDANFQYIEEDKKTYDICYRYIRPYSENVKYIPLIHMDQKMIRKIYPNMKDVFNMNDKFTGKVDVSKVDVGKVDVGKVDVSKVDVSKVESNSIIENSTPVPITNTLVTECEINNHTQNTSGVEYPFDDDIVMNEIYINLLLIASLEPGMTISSYSKELMNTSYWSTSIRRRIYGDNRVNTLDFISNNIREALEKNMKIPFMNKVIQGVQNLKETYILDKKYCKDIDTKMNEIVEKYHIII